LVAFCSVGCLAVSRASVVTLPRLIVLRISVLAFSFNINDEKPS
jgi:hypothetical protein